MGHFLWLLKYLNQGECFTHFEYNVKCENMQDKRELIGAYYIMYFMLKYKFNITFP